MANPYIRDLSGLRFGRLAVVSFSHRDTGRSHWLVHCDCGIEKRVLSGNLVSGRCQSCGCLQKELASAAHTTHGHAVHNNGLKQSREYQSWASMIKRCYNPKHKSFKDYGGRGITVCERWRWSFESFLADMGLRPEGMTLDRIDPNGNYDKANCRWATPLQQRHNRR